MSDNIILTEKEKELIAKSAFHWMHMLKNEQEKNPDLIDEESANEYKVLYESLKKITRNMEFYQRHLKDWPESLPVRN